MTRDDIHRVMFAARYRNWGLAYTFDKDYLIFWWEFDAPDAYEWDGSAFSYTAYPLGRQRSGRTILDMKDLTDDRLVLALFRSVRQAEDHEAREFFRYQNGMPFDPHRKVA